MSRRSKGAHLWYRQERRKHGKLVARATWLILDGGKHYATGCDAGEIGEAQNRLAEHIAAKHQPRRKIADIEAIDVADVLSIYDDDKRGGQANKPKFDERMLRLTRWWGGKMLSDVTAETCRAYVRSRGSPGGARRDLEDLRAAVNYHAKKELHRGIVTIELPEKGLSRDRWLTRAEAAALIWTCWRAREVQTAHRGALRGRKIATDKRPLRHLARFILIGLYTGSRAGAIAAASPLRGEGRSVDLENGRYYRLAQGKRATKKRQPTVALPPRLLAHMRRWRRRGIAREHFVEWNGKPVVSVKTAFKTAVRKAMLPGRVMPHTLRHTAATWLMQNGAPLWQAAGYLGMSVKTLSDVYGHHHPDHFDEAVAAITKRPGQVRQSLVISLEEERAKRTPTHQTIEMIGGPGRTRTCNQTVMSGRL
jgi:integrase